MTPALAVAGWLWTTTTVFASIVTVLLVAVLAADVLRTARLAGDAGPSTSGMRRTIVPLLVCFAAVVILRFALILIERPSR